MAVEFRHSVTVNGVEIDVAVEFREGNEVYVFPELYKTMKSGKPSFWRIYVIGDQYFRESGMVGGAVKQYAPVTATPKNVGRANETTPEDQALFEAFSHWKKKKDELYTEGDAGEVDNVDVGERLRPMLAETYQDLSVKSFPYAASRKIDGVRAMAYLDGNEVVLLSRQGKKYKWMDGIRQALYPILKESGVVLDGEVYSHEIPFSKVSGAARAENKKSKYDERLEYHIFDMYNPNKKDMSYVDRIDLIKQLVDKYPSQRLRYVDYILIFDEATAVKLHDCYVQEGYEGLILRNPNAPYHLGRRTVDLVKYKNFQDQEFKIVDIVDGEGTEKGLAIFVVVEPTTQKTFNVRPRGSFETRAKQFREKHKYIGKDLTVRYQSIGKDVMPRFPVGIIVRDYE